MSEQIWMTCWAWGDLVRAIGTLWHQLDGQASFKVIERLGTQVGEPNGDGWVQLGVHARIVPPDDPRPALDPVPWEPFEPPIYLDDLGVSRSGWLGRD